MNDIYPDWWNKTVTIYNKFTDPQTKVVKWYRTVIDGTFWKYIGEKIAVGRTILETNNTICRIRKDSRYLPKHEWIKIPNDEMKNYFTLAPGDIIVKDNVDDEIQEYVSGHRATDLVAKYKELQGCMTIETSVDNTGGGKGIPHYHVRGI